MGRGIAITMLTIILLVIFWPAAVVGITGSSRPPVGNREKNLAVSPWIGSR